jgi:hypothetical protein
MVRGSIFDTNGKIIFSCNFSGMALQEEYEYAVFRCAFCNTLNPAKKLRPIAPRLQVEGVGTPLKIDDAKKSDSSTSPSEKDSGKCQFLHPTRWFTRSKTEKWFIAGSDSDDSTESKKDENRKKADEERMAEQTTDETSAPPMNGTDEVDEEPDSDVKANDEKKND